MIFSPYKNLKINNMNSLYIGLCISLTVYSCGLFESDDPGFSSEKIYVTKQGDDEIAVINLSDGTIDTILIDYSATDCMVILDGEECGNAGCMWHEMGCMSMSNSTINGPHFTAIDNTNRYLFVTSMESGWVGRYNLDNHQLIDKEMVGNMPALMVLNTDKEKLYVSSMMSMVASGGGMQSRTDISVIDYSDDFDMVMTNNIETSSPSPHAIAINQNGSEVFVATYEGNWLFKISTSLNSVIDAKPLETFTMDTTAPVTRLKPVQCTLTQDSLLFISCEGGVWTGGINTEIIPGQIQMWNTNKMTLVDTLQFSEFNRPWHIVSSAVSKEVYVVLKGQFNAGLYPDSDGVACISYESGLLQLKWHIPNDVFKYLHGIDISDDGTRLFVSGETDANLYELNVEDGSIINTTLLGKEGISKLQGVTYSPN
jgi:DNA-binding beta-propeller fold protein YncE